MTLPSRSRTLLLALASTALLAGCDSEAQTEGTGFWDWLLQGAPSGSGMIVSVGPTSLSEPDLTPETKAGSYLAAQFAQYRQDWTMASTYMHKVMKNDPSNMDLVQRAMVLSMQAGDATRAVALARKVIEEDEDNVLALLFIAMDDFTRSDYGAAESTLDQMPANGIGDFLRPILSAWAKAGETGKPEDDENLLSISPLHAYHALLIADYKGSVKDPERYFVNVIASSGVDDRILESMADIFARRDALSLAKKIYEPLIEDLEQTAPSSERLKRLKDKLENPETIPAPRLKTPTNGVAEAFLNMGRILYHDNSDESALVFARMAQHLDINNDQAAMLLGQLMIRAGHLTDAVAMFESINPHSVDYMDAQRGAADLLEEQGKSDLAIALLERHYAAYKDVNALVQIGDIFRRAEDYEQAIKAYDRAENALDGKIGPEYWGLFYARGMSYERSGNFKRAEKDLKQALEFKPDHPYILNYLGYSWADQGIKLDQAKTMIKRAVELRPDDGYIVDSLGWIYYRLGEYENAVKHLEKAVELVPYDPIINDHLGDAYWKVGRKKEARFQWLRALNHSKDETLNAQIETKLSEGLSNKTPALKEAKSQTSDEKDDSQAP
jgi:tetratricopeptide (TPR) repeat protein